jgi:tRNA nucleotidyltransferase (CCA-adding enzyme)
VGWEHFEHGADVGVRGRGGSREEAFVQAALALTAVLCPPEEVDPVEAVEVQGEGADDEILLYAWLNALIHAMATRGMLFSRFDLRLGEGRFAAVAWGEPLDAARHQPAVEVKGATFTHLRVARDEGRWTAQCVVDV